MAYGARYRIPFLNPGIGDGEGQHFSVVIEERDYTGAETILKGNVDACVLRYVNNDESKYPPLQASQIDIYFYSENDFLLENIITDDDTQFRVILYMGDYKTGEISPKWYGFLNTDDCNEQMQSDPKPIKLTATDGLSLLKAQALYGIDVYEKKTLLTIMQRCLSFTGLGIDLLIEANIFEENMNDRSDGVLSEPFSQCKVHTRSFLSDTNTYDNAYNVISAIMTAFKCTLFQYDGRWHIQRKHDRWNQDMLYGTLYHYDYIAIPPIVVPIPIILPTSIDYKFQVDRKSSTPINADHIKSFVGKSLYTRIEYDYNLPKQIPRNSNFSQGDFLAPVSGPTNTANRIDYWTFSQPDGSEITGVHPYRNQIYDSETRKLIETYIVLPRENPNTDMEVNRLVSEQVEVSAGDKMSISGQIRTKYNYHGPATLSLIQLVLFGDSGTNYSFSTSINSPAYESNIWKTGTGSVIQMYTASDMNSNEWFSFTVQTSGFPESGLLEIRLYNTTLDVNGNEIWLKDLSFDWQLFVSNSIQIRGEYDKIGSNGILRNKVEENIAISDAPKKIISGALFRGDDDTKLTGKWHRQGKEEIENLIRINDIAAYQASHRLYTKIDGSFLGLVYNGKIIGPPTQFTLSAIPNKVYLATNLEISLGQNTFRASLQEFYDTTKDNGDPQGDTRQFQYIYE